MALAQETETNKRNKPHGSSLATERVSPTALGPGARARDTPRQALQAARVPSQHPRHGGTPRGDPGQKARRRRQGVRLGVLCFPWRMPFPQQLCFPSLLGRHLLAQPWGRRKYHLSSTEASLMVLLLARQFGFSLLLFQPCSHCPIYACSPRCVQQTSEGLLYRRAACALPLPQELFRSVFKRQERSPQPHFPCDAHFTRTSLLLCITPQ